MPRPFRWPLVLAALAAGPETAASWVVLFPFFSGWIGRDGATAVAVVFIIAASASVYVMADAKTKPAETVKPAGPKESSVTAPAKGPSYVRFGSRGFESKNVHGLVMDRNTFINTPVTEEGGKNHRWRKNKFK